MSRLIAIGIIFICGLLVDGIRADDETVSALRGQTITLTCPVDAKTCGELHSVKWFKGSERIAVISGDGDVVNTEGELSERLRIDHSPAGPATRLNIDKAKVTDEDTYVCETTFYDPCDSSGAYSIEVKVLVPPSAILVLDEEGNPIRNLTTLGPLREGHTLGGTCEVRGARPAPTVGWYRGGKKLSDSVTIDESNGLFSVKTVYSLVLSRQELGTFIECRVESPALESVVSNQIHLDLQVRPIKIGLSGVKHHTVQGTKVLLQCTVNGARPAANVTWYNSSVAVNAENNEYSTISTKTQLKNDGTFDTISQMIFTATRFENGVSIRCEADNIVMRDDMDRPIHDTLVLEVMYPPVVTVKPDNITVNETQSFLLFCEYEANPASLERVKWLKDGKVIDTTQSRYDGGGPENTALSVKNASRHDIGLYTCELANSIGTDLSDNSIDVDVQFVPIVEIDLEPDSPIIENSETNVTLFCNVVEGNPSTLLKVRWFLEGSLLKELPECRHEGDDEFDELCGVDPSKMLLQNVGRDFLGNYSCEGFNAAGWGERSPNTELDVYYEPGNATLRYAPQIAIKRRSVTFDCSVEDAGNPLATRFRWLRGGKPVMDVVTSTWTVDPVGLDSRTNFSCYAYNEGGDGYPAVIELDVHAPPAFIQKLPPYTGALYTTPGVSLSCRVECIPACSIHWLKDGRGITDEEDDQYYIRDSYLPAEPSTGDFESVLSILHFNMSAWPEEKFDIFKDTANYSCISTNNVAGPGVRSTTYFGVEYPPENTTVSNYEVAVEEGTIPPRVLCQSKAYPEPSYVWRRNGEVIAKGNALIVNKAMTREDGGPYTCTAFNKHGNHSADTVMNILFKPNCTITRKEIDDEDTLICTAIGNPEEFDFVWSLRAENDSIENLKPREEGTSSYLHLEDESDMMRTYRCLANNSVGVGQYCEIDVAGHLAWWQRWDRMTLYILIAVVAALLLAVIIICCVIICICRKRRRQNKYQTDLSSSGHQSALHDQTMDSTLSTSSPPIRPRQPQCVVVAPPVVPEIPKSPPKWPLRPGVLVHLKTDTKQNLCAARGQPTTPSVGGSPQANSSQLLQNVSYASPIFDRSLDTVDPQKPHKSLVVSPAKTPPVLPARNSHLINNNVDDAISRKYYPGQACETAGGDNNDELVNFTNSNFVERILNRLRWRRSRVNDNVNPADGNAVETGEFEKLKTGNASIWARGNRCAAQLLRGNKWFGNVSGKSTQSSTELVDSQMDQTSQPCTTDTVVTYKRTGPGRPTAPKPARQDKPTGTSPSSFDPSVRRKRKISGHNVHDKSSVAGDPLTEPGEYENLPFHGLQSAPNKLFLTSTNPNSNVVRVAPRPKNPNYLHTTNIQASAVNNNPPAQPNANFPINCFNYINYQPTTTVSQMTVRQHTAGKERLASGGDVKFNSLKSLITKKSPHFYSIKANKCKRHHSFIDPQHAMYNQSREFNSIHVLQNDLQPPSYEQPMYENLTDSIQIRESPPPHTESSFAAVLADMGQVEGGRPDGMFYERTIHRSDSGISNSSYECITPTPAPRVNGSVSKGRVIKTPVYMNLPFLRSSSSASAFYGLGKFSSSKSSKFNSANTSEHECERNNFKNINNNPFIASSHRKKQILVPKELFPTFMSSTSSSSGDGSILVSKRHVNVNKSTRESSRRPIKLPLRKHHSFSFQPSQTVAGVIKQKKTTTTTTTTTFVAGEGPLVFKPAPLDETVVFKPITPVPKSPNKLKSHSDKLDSSSSSHSNSSGASINLVNSNSISNREPSNGYPYDSSSSISKRTSGVHTSSGNLANNNQLPRICGTNLKSAVPDKHKGKTPPAVPVKPTIANTYNCMDQSQVSSPSSSSSTLTANRRIVYADLVMPKSTSSSSSNSNSTASNTTNNNSLPLSEQSRTSDDESIKLTQFNGNGRKPTQYAVLKFNEVNI